MKRLHLFALIFLVLLLAGCTFWLQEIAPGVYQGGLGRGPQTLTASPSPTATNTSSPTHTPTATAAPSHTPTPGTTPQPTQDPIDRKCFGTVIDGPLNVRAAPWGDLLGQVAKGDILALGALQRSYKDDWWYRIYWSPGVEGFVYATLIAISPDADCTSLPELPSQNRKLVGLHLIYSAEEGAVMDIAPYLGTLKGTDGTEKILRRVKAAYPHVIIVWRSLYLVGMGKQDCPPGWGQGDPIAAADHWYEAQYATWQARDLLVSGLVGYFEYRNECRFMGEWEIQFDLRMLQRANADHLCLAMFSDGYGNPEPLEFAMRIPVFKAMLATECQPGKHPVIALHTYGNVSSGQWIFFRWRLFLDLLPPWAEDMQFVFTEFGVTNTEGKNDGRGVADPVTVAREIADAVREYQKYPEVIGFHVFSVGHSPEWIDVTNAFKTISAFLKPLLN